MMCVVMMCVVMIGRNGVFDLYRYVAVEIKLIAKALLVINALRKILWQDGHKYDVALRRTLSEKIEVIETLHWLSM